VDRHFTVLPTIRKTLLAAIDYPKTAVEFGGLTFPRSGHQEFGYEVDDESHGTQYGGIA
jgi:hypothetical protein